MTDLIKIFVSFRIFFLNILFILGCCFVFLKHGKISKTWWISRLPNQGIALLCECNLLSWENHLKSFFIFIRDSKSMYGFMFFSFHVFMVFLVEKTSFFKFGFFNTFHFFNHWAKKGSDPKFAYGTLYCTNFF